MNYTFHSTDPDNYNECQCPVIYTGVSKLVKWWASEIISNYNVILLDKSDYIEFELVDNPNKRWYPSKRVSVITSNLDLTFDDDNEGNDINIRRTEIDTFKFSSSQRFSINDMTYNCAQCFGFYYTTNYNIESTFDNDPKSNTYQSWVIESKAMGYRNGTPVYFLISNLGQPNQINKENDKWKPIFPAILMNIQNSFQNGASLFYSNSDYQSVSPVAALSNLRVKLVDANLVPVHIFNPMYVTIQVEEIPDEERQP